ncbi:MAG: hypothetical protein AABN33_18390 [Acidobacteriota bacterium]
MASPREVVQGRQTQGVDEKVPYKITTTPWGTGPAAVSVVVKKLGASGTTDVTSTVMPSGAPSVAGDVITLPKLQSLAAGSSYRVEVKFDVGGSTLEAYFFVDAED